MRKVISTQHAIARRLKPTTCSRKLHLAPPFLVEDYRPKYVETMRSGKMEEKVKKAKESLRQCNMCPRYCNVNRYEQSGVCMIGSKAIVASAFPHFGEEACLQGWNGSGTIFFSGCNMKCTFCQNWDISHKTTGWELTPAEIADLMLKLQEETKCHNINFVTPEHVVPQVVEAIFEAVKTGLRVPIVYNTSSYDCHESLELMDGLVDIYMPDFKVWEDESGMRLLKAKNYPGIAKKAIQEMNRQVGFLRFSPDGIAQSGVLLRHLVMPGKHEEGAKIMQWVSKELGIDTFVHIMEQYRPDANVGKEDVKGDGTSKIRYADINRTASAQEIRFVENAAKEAGLWRFNV